MYNKKIRVIEINIFISIICYIPTKISHKFHVRKKKTTTNDKIKFKINYIIQ